MPNDLLDRCSHCLFLIPLPGQKCQHVQRIQNHNKPRRPLPLLLHTVIALSEPSPISPITASTVSPF
ncbi:hypothetical protein MA16_Dca000811 [Dendrobium catenatum]|uniref:Uncharacterized protein n=1 Tax=Dendrobium catenatum TaxID=906689 RepID=A0A2I0WUX1_9ASPA|nr:hypothetical protein MA16_Dca000811 [Dendrobium catenatum]